MIEHDNPAPDVPETYSAAYVAALRHEAEQRVVLAEMKAAALAAGMVDADGLKLLDLGRVRVGEGGAIEIPDGFFEEARQAKPYLFARMDGTRAEALRTGSTARVPAVQAPQARNATEMSVEEWQAARAALLRRS